MIYLSKDCVLNTRGRNVSGVKNRREMDFYGFISGE